MENFRMCVRERARLSISFFFLSLSSSSHVCVFFVHCGVDEFSIGEGKKIHLNFGVWGPCSVHLLAVSARFFPIVNSMKYMGVKSF